MIHIQELPEYHLAAVHHTGVKGIENAFEKLTLWAYPKGLFNNPKAKMGRIFYDSFKYTEADKVRMSVFLITDTVIEIESEIKKLTIPKGKYIVGRFEINPSEFEKSWTSLFIWMNENGYQKREENPFEIYHNDYREHPENKCLVDLHIPVD